MSTQVDFCTAQIERFATDLWLSLGTTYSYSHVLLDLITWSIRDCNILGGLEFYQLCKIDQIGKKRYKVNKFGQNFSCLQQKNYWLHAVTCETSLKALYLFRWPNFANLNQEPSDDLVYQIKGSVKNWHFWLHFQYITTAWLLSPLLLDVTHKKFNFSEF